MGYLTNSIIQCLVNSWSDPASLIAHNDNLSNFKGGEVAQTELFEFSFAVQLIECLESDVERGRPITSMEILHVQAVCLELTQRLLKLFSENCRLVRTRAQRIPFGGNRETTFFPACFGGEGFLAATIIESSSINFLVTRLLENIQALLELIERCDAGSMCRVGPNIHHTKDNSSCRICRFRHLDILV